MITNTLKHAVYGAFAMLLFCILNDLLNLTPNTILDIRAFGFVAIILLALNLENNQRKWSGLSWKKYLRLRWLDTALDLIAGIGAAGVVLWLWKLI